LISGDGKQIQESVPNVAGRPVTFCTVHTFDAISYFLYVGKPVPEVIKPYTDPYATQFN